MAASSSTKNPVLSGVAGGMAGVCEITVTMPLDTIKTQMQLQAGKSAQAPSMMSTTKMIISGPRGVGGLYAGMSAMVAQVSFKAGIRFTAQTQLKLSLDGTVGCRGSNTLSPVMVNFLSGIGAGIVEAAVWVTPTERLKVLRQAELSSGSSAAAPGFRQSIVLLHQQQGFGGFFVGLVPTALRQGIAMGIRFALYGESKKAIKIVNDSALNSAITPGLQLLLAGMSTGIVSSLVNQPIDTAKSRIQAAAKGEKAYSGTIDCLAKMYQQGGIRAWYAGCGPRVMRLTIGQGIIFSCQEGFSDFLHTTFH